MTAIRSLSLTRSSSAPVTTVSPSAQAAATKNAGNSSIASGTRRSGTRMPRSAGRPHLDVGDGLGTRGAVIDAAARSAPISAQHLEQARARRVDADAFDR